MPKTTTFLSGSDVRLWRTSRKLSQTEVAQRLGITRKAVSHFEARGTSRILALALSAIDHGLEPWSPDFDPHISSGIEDFSAPLTEAEA